MSDHYNSQQRVSTDEDEDAGEECTRIQCSICRGGGVIFPLVPLNPQVCIDPKNIVKISQTYIAVPGL